MQDGEGARLSLIPRKQAVLDYLVRTGISDENLLKTPGTPQYEAALWIADHDAYRMKVPEGNSIDDRFLERYALAVFFHSTGGATQWRYDANFLQPTDICDWNGLTLSPKTGNPMVLGVTGCKEVVDASGTSQLYARDISLCKFLCLVTFFFLLPVSAEALMFLMMLVLFCADRRESNGWHHPR
jgi:hypothetical protein